MADTEPELIFSGLNQVLEVDGHRLDVQIYRGDNSDWILEVVDETNASIVWDDQFPTDQAAFDEFQRAVSEEGVGSILNARSARKL